jgi:hypothetical protein
MTDSDPSMAFGDSWWSMIVVVPDSSASRAASFADHSSISRSRALSSRHQTRSRISRNVVGVFGGAGMPRARAE